MLNTFKYCFALIVLFLLFDASFSQAGGKALPSPSNICEIRQSVWCIYNGARKIVDQKPEVDSMDASIWFIHGAVNPEKPLVILEPIGCRIGLSDDLELISYDQGIEWSTKKWVKMVFRLKKDKSCDLSLLSPSKEDDPIGEAFSNGLTLVQACSTLDCKGDVLGQKLSIKDLNQHKLVQ